MAVVLHRQVAVRAVKQVADPAASLRTDVRLAVGDPVPHVRHQHLLLPAAVELPGGGDGVGRLLVVVEHEVTAHGADLGRVGHAQAPALHVDLVQALVPHVAVAVFPLPVEVVVEPVPREGAYAGGPQPQVVVDARGHGFLRRAADRVAPFEAQRARHVDIPDEPAAQLLDRFPHRGLGPLVGALLHDALVLAGRGHDLARFEHVVRARLLHVDVLARLAGPDRLHGVGVVRRGDGNRVDALVLEHLPDIHEPRRPLPASALHLGDAPVEHRLVDIADGRDLHVLHRQIRPHVVDDLAHHAHAGNPHRIVGTC